MLKVVYASLDIYKLYLFYSPSIMNNDWLRVGDVVSIFLTTQNTEVFEFVLSVGGNPGRTLGSERQYYIFLPLEWASYICLQPDLEISLLIEYDALVKGMYALQLAVMCERVKTVRLLLEARTEVHGLVFEAQNPDGSKQVWDTESDKSRRDCFALGCLLWVAGSGETAARKWDRLRGFG